MLEVHASAKRQLGPAQVVANTAHQQGKAHEQQLYVPAEHMVCIVTKSRSCALQRLSTRAETRHACI
jgi:hypothetical protein